MGINIEKLEWAAELQVIKTQYHQKNEKLSGEVIVIRMTTRITKSNLIFPCKFLHFSIRYFISLVTSRDALTVKIQV